ncbi:MAG: hypothetical protein JOZ96_08650 [Acidobacteria bacterium]|nr:hypothetical protein [Acidobacteriota bacterium]
MQSSRANEVEVTPTAVGDPTRKTFVEPEVSFPVDVLEATTFFQFTESGVSN